MHAVLSCVKI